MCIRDSDKPMGVATYRTAQEMPENLRKTLPAVSYTHLDVYKRQIRDNVSLAEAPIKGMNILEYNKNSNGAKDYMKLAKEVLSLIHI